MGGEVVQDLEPWLMSILTETAHEKRIKKGREWAAHDMCGTRSERGNDV